MKKSTLRIKSHYSIIPHSAQQVELRSGVWNPTSFVINDASNSNKLYPILKDLNGQSTTQEMAQKHQVTKAEIEKILDHLQQLDVIENTVSEHINNYIETFVLQSGGVIENQKNILIIGEDTISNEIKRMIVNSTGADSIATVDVSDPAIKNVKTNAEWMFDSFMLQEAVDQFSWWKDYFVVLALTQNDPLLAMRINQINHTLGIPWIHGAIDGPFIFVGPTFQPKSGACYHCFEKRITMNLHEYASYQRYKEMSVFSEEKDIDTMKLSPAVLVLSAHLAMEIINYCFLNISFTKSKALSMYLPTMEICFNEVLRLSGCPVCGSIPHRDDQQLYYDYQTLLEQAAYD